MKRYIFAYALWLTAVIAIAAILLEWYRHVEDIAWSELTTRLRDGTDSTDDS